MIDDVDWKLLNARIESIERSIEMLKAVFPPKDEGSGYVGTDYSGHSYYILKEGSLMDYGTKQVWRDKDGE